MTAFDQPQQRSFFDPPDPPAVEVVRQEGIARADANAPPAWKRAAFESIVICASTLPDGFTADDVWQMLVRLEVPLPHNPSALGGVFQAAARSGQIEKTGLARRTVFPHRHRDLTVWRGKGFDESEKPVDGGR